jgi:hypothetical protein
MAPEHFLNPLERLAVNQGRMQPVWVLDAVIVTTPM